MHLPDGLVPLGMALAGHAAAGGLAALCLWRISRRPDPQADIPRAAMLTAVFVAATLVALPVPPTTVHPMLAGLMGVMLGWFAVPAILIGLFLQAVLFGHGGLTTLGLNGLIFGLPALAAWAGWRLLAPRWPRLAALVAGAGAAVLALVLFAALALAGLPAALDPAAERAALGLMALAHLPLVVVEAAIVLAVLQTLRRIEPGLLPRV